MYPLASAIDIAPHVFAWSKMSALTEKEHTFFDSPKGLSSNNDNLNIKRFWENAKDIRMNATGVWMNGRYRDNKNNAVTRVNFRGQTNIICWSSSWLAQEHKYHIDETHFIIQRRYVFQDLMTRHETWKLLNCGQTYKCSGRHQQTAERWGNKGRCHVVFRVERSQSMANSGFDHQGAETRQNSSQLRI